jgi:hypothetical protein
MASSDWKLQVDQIDEEARAYMWGNNFAAFEHDMTGRDRPPFYNFVVADETIDPFQLETLFGFPARTESCKGHEVLVYDHAIVPEGIDYRPSTSFKLKFVPE